MSNLPDERRGELRKAIERDYGCRPGAVHEGYGAECDSSAHAPALYRTFGCDHAAHVADALAPMLARWLAEEREGIARAIEGHACNGSPESCDDALAGAPCPYDDAASIARNYRQEKADGEL